MPSKSTAKSDEGGERTPLRTRKSIGGVAASSSGSSGSSGIPLADAPAEMNQAKTSASGSASEANILIPSTFFNNAKYHGQDRPEFNRESLKRLFTALNRVFRNATLGDLSHTTGQGTDGSLAPKSVAHLCITLGELCQTYYDCDRPPYEIFQNLELWDLGSGSGRLLVMLGFMGFKVCRGVELRDNEKIASTILEAVVRSPRLPAYPFSVIEVAWRDLGDGFGLMDYFSRTLYLKKSHEKIIVSFCQSMPPEDKDKMLRKVMAVNADKLQEAVIALALFDKLTEKKNFAEILSPSYDLFKEMSGNMMKSGEVTHMFFFILKKSRSAAAEEDGESDRDIDSAIDSGDRGNDKNSDSKIESKCASDHGSYSSNSIRSRITETDSEDGNLSDSDEQPRDEQSRDEQSQDEQSQDEQSQDELSSNSIRSHITETDSEDGNLSGSDEQSQDEQSLDEQSRDEQSRDEQSQDEQPHDDQPHDDQPQDEQSLDEQSQDEQSQDEQNKQDSPGDSGIHHSPEPPVSKDAAREVSVPKPVNPFTEVLSSCALKALMSRFPSFEPNGPAEVTKGNIIIITGEIPLSKKKKLLVEFNFQKISVSLDDLPLSRTEDLLRFYSSKRAPNNPLHGFLKEIPGDVSSMMSSDSYNFKVLTLEPTKGFFKELEDMVRSTFQKNGRIPSEWRYCFRDLLNAVCFMHHNRITHLQLSGEALRKTSKGQVILAETGLSQMHADFKYCFRPNDIHKVSDSATAKLSSSDTQSKGAKSDSVKGKFMAEKDKEQLAILGNDRFKRIGVEGYKSPWECDSEESAKQADLWAVGVMLILPFTASGELVEIMKLQSKLHDMYEKYKKVTPMGLLNLIDENLDRHGIKQEAPCRDVVQIAIRIAKGENPLTYTKKRVVHEFRACTLYNMLELAAYLMSYEATSSKAMSSEASAEKSFFKPFCTSYIPDDERLERGLLIEGMSVEENDDMKSANGRKSSRRQLMKPVVVILIPGMGLNVFSVMNTNAKSVVANYGGKKQPRARRDEPPGLHKSSLHTVLLACGNELDGSAMDPGKDHAPSLACLFEAGSIGAFLASSRVDPSKKTKGNVILQTTNSETTLLHVSIDGRDVHALPMHSREPIKKFTMLNWDYNWANICGTCPFTDEEIQAMIDSYTIEPLEIPLVMEILKNARERAMEMGYRDDFPDE